MGFTLTLLMYGLIFIEEVERTPVDEWRAGGWRAAVWLPRCRRRPAFIFALLVSVGFALVEVKLLMQGRGTFEWLNSSGVLALLGAGYWYAVRKKGDK